MNHLAVDLTLGRTPDPNVEKIKGYIIQHIDEDISPKSVIAFFGLPYNKTRTLFHKKTGETMAAYIRRLRQNNAAECNGRKKTEAP